MEGMNWVQIAETADHMGYPQKTKCTLLRCHMHDSYDRIQSNILIYTHTHYVHPHDRQRKQTRTH